MCEGNAISRILTLKSINVKIDVKIQPVWVKKYLKEVSGHV